MGFIVGPQGQRLSYGALAAEAAKLPLDPLQPLKERADFALIGCDACTVPMGDVPVRSCSLLASEVGDGAVMTIETSPATSIWP